MTKNDNKKLKEIIDLACEEAKRLGNTKVSPEHLFLGMLRMDQARAIDVLIALGVDFYEVKAKIEQKLNKHCLLYTSPGSRIFPGRSEYRVNVHPGNAEK